jgi:hypothetical protein
MLAMERKLLEKSSKPDYLFVLCTKCTKEVIVVRPFLSFGMLLWYLLLLNRVLYWKFTLNFDR